MDKPTLNEQAAWTEIMYAADQPTEYYRWCDVVLSAHKAGQITQIEAARMISPRQHMANQFGQLDQTADVQIVMDYAADIYDGAAYIGVEENLKRDWDYITEVVNRHL